MNGQSVHTATQMPARPPAIVPRRQVPRDVLETCPARKTPARARRPVLIAGHGARQATGPLRALAERLNAPVLTTFKAKGLIPDTHPLGAGVLGRSGTPVASWLMNEADLLIVVGASFANHTGIAP